jgi:hypothetical protein
MKRSHARRGLPALFFLAAFCAAAAPARAVVYDDPAKQSLDATADFERELADLRAHGFKLVASELPRPDGFHPPGSRHRLPLSEVLDVRLARDCETNILTSLGAVTKQRAAQQVREIFIETVEEGLDRLEAFSPELAAQILENVSGRGVELDCRLNSKIFSGLYVPVLRRIYTPRLGDAAEIELAFHDERGARKPPPPEESGYIYEESMGLSKQVIFHEFLHLAGLDNVPVWVHDERFHDLEADRVYACSALAYPAWAYPIVCDRMGEHCAEMTARACQTCVGDDAAEVQRCQAAFPETPRASGEQ